MKVFPPFFRLQPYRITGLLQSSGLCWERTFWDIVRAMHVQIAISILRALWPICAIGSIHEILIEVVKTMYILVYFHFILAAYGRSLLRITPRLQSPCSDY